MKHLISISLIAVYSIVLLHSVLPHYHIVEDHSKVESHEATHHDHGHSHDHDHHQVSTVFDALIDFLGQLGHHDIGEDHLDNYVANNVTNLQIEKESITSVFLSEKEALNYCLLEKFQLDAFERPPILYELINSSSDPLRGPPSNA